MRNKKWPNEPKGLTGGKLGSWRHRKALQEQRKQQATYRKDKEREIQQLKEQEEESAREEAKDRRYLAKTAWGPRQGRKSCSTRSSGKRDLEQTHTSWRPQTGERELKHQEQQQRWKEGPRTDATSWPRAHRSPP